MQVSVTLFFFVKLLFVNATIDILFEPQIDKNW